MRPLPGCYASSAWPFLQRPAPRFGRWTLDAGDRLFLYATRGAWRNPTRDRGRIIGAAQVLNAVRAFDDPIEIAGRRFHSGCGLEIDGLVPYTGGVELRPLVSRLAAFPKPDAWSIYLRRPLLALPGTDAAIIQTELGTCETTREAALATYPVPNMASAG